MESQVQGILNEGNDSSRRATLCREACTTLEHFEHIEATSILEMALWKCKLEEGGFNRQLALDRDESRIVGGADLNVVIPHVAMFYIEEEDSEDDWEVDSGEEEEDSDESEEESDEDGDY